MKVLTKTKSDTNQARRQSSVTGGHTQFFLGGHKNFFHSNVKEKVKKTKVFNAKYVRNSSDSGVKLKKKGLYGKIREKTVFAHEFWGNK